jgi:sterol desaturase/sphingolipid hydroxylase (fatty acid hydroxylase superfamily)
MNEVGRYFGEFFQAFWGTAQWTWRSIIFEVPWYQNYFWGLLLISLLVWGLEIVFPWRKNQSIIRKDFWLDGVYMFFNFFIFSIAINGFYRLSLLFFSQLGIESHSLTLVHISSLPTFWSLLVFFVVLDFAQWATHVLLHRIPFLWRFHQVHHSVKEMGFAAHFRYHWMENILYKPFKTLAIMLLGGFEPEHAFVIHFLAITIGHLNHANVKISWGPLKYLFNSPVMHLYHHAHDLPDNRFGVNFGISLSVWDYLFGFNYIPEAEGKIVLGYPGDATMPKNFWGQLRHGWKTKKS